MNKQGGTEKVRIKNRDGKTIVVLVEIPIEKPTGLVFIMHGLGGFKEQVHLENGAKTFFGKGLAVVRFDTTHTFGESEGSYENANVTNYYEDLEDVIVWASHQEWYKEPFFLVGHSLGGMCTTLFAQKHPEKVRGLAPLASVISNKLKTESAHPEEIARWEKTGWKITPSESKPGLMKRLKWNQFADDLKKYDLLPEAYKLTMPVLLIVGSEDRSTPSDHQKILFDTLPGPKEFHIIEGSPHTFRDPKHLAEIKTILEKWIDSVLALRQ